MFTAPTVTMPDFDTTKPCLPNLMQYIHDLLFNVVDSNGDQVIGTVFIGDLPKPPFATPIVAQVTNTEKLADPQFPGPNPPPPPHKVPLFIRVYVVAGDHNTANILVRQLEYYLSSTLLIADTTFGGTCIGSSYDTQIATYGSGVNNNALAPAIAIKILAEFSN